jgi:hypothetical protein
METGSVCPDVYGGTGTSALSACVTNTRFWGREPVDGLCIGWKCWTRQAMSQPPAAFQVETPDSEIGGDSYKERGSVSTLFLLFLLQFGNVSPPRATSQQRT